MMQLIDQILTPKKNRPCLRSFQIKTQTHGRCWAPLLYQILTRASPHSNKCHQIINKYTKDEPDINVLTCVEQG